MYGLRPIGGSLDSDDEEEREHRQNARDARAFLNSIKMAEPPTREQVRKVVEGKSDTAVRRVQALVESEAADDAVSSGAAPTASTAAKAPRAPRSTAAKSDNSATAAPRATGRSSRAVDVDLATLESRVTGLLDKLTTIETQLAEHSDTESLGLAARSRVKDLERQRTTVLHTLAALEKARRLQTQ